ncbi:MULTISPECIES: type I polyketide synthase [unclassified Dolichospermum]|uniref:PfaB family protein n=1 Tax=unclassified Dolichospermum TaxID=2622029 RepID=UPI0014476C58|nr:MULTISPECIES: type I polyketide synthase [unclassified Dolichospermum]MTJ19346.1 type I polyketide synthase [Dolichospermum sp. UHCC 0299]MTJ40906.1 type I polyketide synthase [Dolichospermum sp. UHCC 0406]
MNIQQHKTAKMAIVGMDAFFGECQELDAFESSIYDGKQHFIPLPESRWHGINEQETLLREYGLEAGKVPQGAYIDNFEVDTLAYKIPPNEVEKINSQQLLLLRVADRALKDAGLSPNNNVAVIIAADTELSVHQLQQRWNSSWQIKDGLNGAEIALSPEKINQLEGIVQDSIHNQVELSEYLSYVTNIMASRISSLWNFSGPSFTISAVETAAFKALELAQMLLDTNEVDAVVVGAVDLAGGVENVLLRSQFGTINTGVNTLSFDEKANGWNVGEGAGAVVLKRHDTALANNQRIYAVIDGISIGQSPSMAVDSHTISQVCQQAFQQAGIEPTKVNYLEVCASGIPAEDEAEISGILQAYPAVGDGLHCAIGSVKANIGHTFVASGIASLIKTALSIYHRYIPGTPNWSGVKTPQVWEGSPFYVATESRPWFLQKEVKSRISAINSIGCDGSFAHIILSEETAQPERTSTYLESRPLHLLPIAADDQSSLLAALDHLQATIENADSLKNIASQTFVKFQQNSESKYTLSLTGRNQKELIKEINSAKKGVINAFANGKDWQTPIGSYFTPKPLGKNGEIAFVYPAAVNTYLGIGRSLFRLFPKVLDDVIIKSLDERAADVEKLVFPRSLSKLSTRQLETLEKKLLDDSLAMFEAEVLFTRLISTIITEDFNIKPKYVLGYSLGETSMMVAQGVWSNFYEVSHTFNSSALFGDRLSGSKNAVREYWGLPKTDTNPENKLWANYVLMATPAQVRECLKNETRVYLTQINTPEEVLIAGEPAACERVIKTLGCNSFPAPFDHVIHCQAMQSESQELETLYTLPAQKIPGIKFYSAAEYQSIEIESNQIAHNIATGLCQQLDFPRLVNRVYGDGAKIFIEAGAGGICSRWIDKNLGNQEHLTVSLNRRGTDDHSSLIKALAKLLSHQVNLNLTPLYNLSSENTQQKKAALRKVTLGGNSMTSAILNAENRQIFANNQKQTISPHQEYKIINSLQTSEKIAPTEIYPKPQKNTMKTIMENGLELSKKLKFFESTKIIKQNINQESSGKISMNDLKIAQYQNLSNNTAKLTKTHTSFLAARQDFSQQMSEIIQLQLACAQNLLNEEK